MIWPKKVEHYKNYISITIPEAVNLLQILS